MIDNSTSVFVVKVGGVPILGGRRTVSTDGKVMTIESWTVGDGEERRKTLEFWEKNEWPISSV